MSRSRRYLLAGATRHEAALRSRRRRCSCPPLPPPPPPPPPEEPYSTPGYADDYCKLWRPRRARLQTRLRRGRGAGAGASGLAACRWVPGRAGRDGAASVPLLARTSSASPRSFGRPVSGNTESACMWRAESGFKSPRRRVGRSDVEVARAWLAATQLAGEPDSGTPGAS